MKRKVLNWMLLISFVVTIMVPVTGIHIHKLASVIFLLLSLLHTVIYRRQLGAKKWGILLLIMVSFLTGIFGMVYDHIPLVIKLHRLISIAVVFFLAIHIFVYHKRMFKRKGRICC